MSFNVRNDTLHAIADKSGDLLEFLGPFCDAPDFLLKLGAVYLNKKRALQTLPVKPGDYIRAHLKPKRFPHDQIDWKKIVRLESEAFLIVNKPAGLPVHPTLDNARENLVALLSQARDETILGTHRLDQPTQGLVCLARNPKAAALFHRWLRKRRVLKKYRVWTDTPLSLGTQTHYLLASPHGAKTVFDEPGEGRLRSELEVIKSLPLSQGFESEIVLRTGRTHQIRAQLKHLGAPIVGDVLYGGRSHPILGLQSFSLSFPDPVSYHCELSKAPWSH